MYPEIVLKYIEGLRKTMLRDQPGMNQVFGERDISPGIFFDILTKQSFENYQKTNLPVLSEQDLAKALIQLVVEDGFSQLTQKGYMQVAGLSTDGVTLYDLTQKGKEYLTQKQKNNNNTNSNV